jgi:hypothetical protein
MDKYRIERVKITINGQDLESFMDRSDKTEKITTNHHGMVLFSTVPDPLLWCWIGESIPYAMNLWWRAIGIDR